MQDWLLYIGSAIIFVWGVAHIVPVGSVVKGFGAISEDNRRIITMEWVAEGLTLCFIGFLVFITTLLAQDGQTADIVYLSSAGMLLVMAVWTLVTGARTSIVPIKICPLVKTAVAVLFISAVLI